MTVFALSLLVLSGALLLIVYTPGVVLLIVYAVWHNWDVRLNDDAPRAVDVSAHPMRRSTDRDVS